MFGEGGRWGTNFTARAPDILTIEVGLHTCVHAWDNATTLKRHEVRPPVHTFSVCPLHVVARFVTTPKHLTSCPMITQEDVPKLMKAITTAIGRHKTASGATTLVIISTAGRGEYNTQHSLKMSECTWRFARILTHEAHKAGEQGRHLHRHLSTSPMAHIHYPPTPSPTPPAARVLGPRTRRNRASVAVPIRALHARAQHEARAAPRKPRVQHRRHVLARAHLVPAEERDVAVAPGECRALAPVSPRLPVRAPHAASWVLQRGTDQAVGCVTDLTPSCGPSLCVQVSSTSLAKAGMAAADRANGSRGY